MLLLTITATRTVVSCVSMPAQTPDRYNLHPQSSFKLKVTKRPVSASSLMALECAAYKTDRLEVSIWLYGLRMILITLLVIM